MILRNISDLSKEISKDRQEMYELAKSKNLCDPDVVKISQRLDRKIIMMQQIIYTARSARENLSYS
ncbi:aspartyl-phosphate phosphatase Spo0E family protein [Ectobacillus funiculus]|uniref:Spo0E family sporulation regulatory protein-aspartic acid phosphatase n=1 Tax=Ectobacillus funiculus TaxID=137993 RepID=UPI00397DC00A